MRHVELAWKAGERSARMKAKGPSRNVRFDKWDWETAFGDLEEWCAEKLKSDMFNPVDRNALKCDLADEIGRIGNWARSKDEKRVDWTSLAKNWITTEIEKNASRTPSARWGRHSTTSWPASDQKMLQKQESRAAQATRLLGR
jgi:hypothetical protein